MPRYKLRPVEYGQVIELDDGELCAFAETIAEARDLFDDWTGERPMYLHSAVASYRVVYARDIEDGECHEDAEPGDTTFTIHEGDPRRESDRRVWMLGAPRLCSWRIVTVKRPLDPQEIPVGASILHERIGSGAMAGSARAIGGWWWLPVRFADRELLCKASTVFIVPTIRWAPKSVYRLEINDETIAEGDQWALQTLLGAHEDRLRAEWEAEHFDEEFAALRADR